MSNAYEQFDNQRQLARIQRRHHGAETALDKAEVRHDEIYSWLMRARGWVPFLLILCVGWIGFQRGIVLASSITAYLVTLCLSILIARIWDGIVGKFRDDDVLIKTEHFWLTTFGVINALIGVVVGPGMVLAGIIQAATPYVWTRWARRVYQNTDYSRMKANMAEPEAPRLYE